MDRTWEYIDRLQTHECGYWPWGHAIPFLGTHKSKFLCSVDCGGVSNLVHTRSQRNNRMFYSKLKKGSKRWQLIKLKSGLYTRKLSIWETFKKPICVIRGRAGCFIRAVTATPGVDADDRFAVWWCGTHVGGSRRQEHHGNYFDLLNGMLKAVFRIRICRIRKFLGLPDTDPSVICTDPDPSLIQQKW